MLGQVLTSVNQLLGGREEEFRDWDKRGRDAGQLRRGAEAASGSSAWSSPRSTAASASAPPPTRARCRRSPGTTPRWRSPSAPTARSACAGSCSSAPTSRRRRWLPQPRHRRDHRRLLPHRAGRRLRRRGRARPPPCAGTATTGCSTARSCGSPTAASPTSSPSSPRRPTAAGGKAHMTAFVVTRDMPGVVDGPPRGQDGHPRLLHHHRAPRRRAGARRPRAGRASGQGFKVAMKHPQRRPHRPGGRLRGRA